MSKRTEWRKMMSEDLGGPTPPPSKLTTMQFLKACRGGTWIKGVDTAELETEAREAAATYDMQQNRLRKNPYLSATTMVTECADGVLALRLERRTGGVILNQPIILLFDDEGITNGGTTGGM